MYNEKMLESFSQEYAERCQVTDKITAEMFDANGVLRGLRDKNGNGVRLKLSGWKTDRKSPAMEICGTADIM